MREVFELEKKIWTETDFDVMSWHDCPIHAISFDNNGLLLFDIDYIFKWVKTKDGRRYNFWISPCTLAFEYAYNIVFESEHLEIIIDNISRENPQKLKNTEHIDRAIVYDWIIETTVGEVSFKSIGYKQYVRQSPILIEAQKLDLEIRKGIQFDQTSYI